MSRIPKATLQRSNPHNNTATIDYTTTPPNDYISANQIGDVGGWIYSSTSGDCRINCNHRDTASVNLADSTLYYSNYGHEEP
jgi:hypothetical protein